MKTAEQIEQQVQRIWNNAPKTTRCRHEVCLIGGKKIGKMELWQIAAKTRSKYGISRFRPRNTQDAQ